MKSVRERVTEYSKGDNLDLFWRLFRLRERTRSRLGGEALTFLLSRMARRHGGYVGRTAVIEGFLSLPHGLHGVYISRYASIGADCRINQIPKRIFSMNAVGERTPSARSGEKRLKSGGIA